MKCEICNKEFSHLGNHLRYHHNITSQEYYDKYLKTTETEGLCNICGKPTKFLGLSKGYRDTCSSSCGSKQGLILTKQIKLEKYNDENYNNREKAKNTCIEQWGVENPSQVSEIQEKIQTTRSNRYGEHKEAITIKSQNTLTKNFGSIKKAYKEINTKGNKTKKDKSIEFSTQNNLITVVEVNQKYGVGWYNNAKDLNIELIKYNNVNYIKLEDLPKVEKYTNERHAYCGYSNKEKEVVNYLKSIYSGDIIENTKQIIKPLELDIYIPDKNIAIEFNGAYHHSINTGTPINYHLNKSLLCEEKGIRLIHIYEWELEEPYWSKIKVLLNNIFHNNSTIYATNCNIKEISNEKAKVLNNKINLHEHKDAQITYGLYYNDELIQLMSFSKTENDNEWYIVRISTNSNIYIIDGLSKLFNYFIKLYHPNKVIAECDFNKFSGKSYEKIGMSFIRYTGPIKEIRGENILYDSGSKIYEWRC